MTPRERGAASALGLSVMPMCWLVLTTLESAARSGAVSERLLALNAVWILSACLVGLKLLSIREKGQ
jgi:hypothetical protein